MIRFGLSPSPRRSWTNSLPLTPTCWPSRCTTGGVSQHVKNWIDLILTDPRLGPGQDPLLAGRPAALIVTRGGGYGPGTPRAGWDHATPYYRRVFGDVLGLQLHVNEIELTLADFNPAMAPFRDQARQLLESGHASAEKHGELLAQHVLTKSAR
jgi:FMN-dependent NADH-azoreductase